MSVSAGFAVTMKGDKPLHTFDLIEMQGEVVFMDAKAEAEATNATEPSPLGTLLLPETGKGCTLRMSTLSLAGDAGNVKVPLLVMRRKAAPEGAPCDGAIGGKRPREEDNAASSGVPLEEQPPMLLSEAWAAGILDVPQRTDVGASRGLTVTYEIVGSVVKKYHFKSKTTRQFTK